MRNDRLEQLFRMFDIHYARIKNIVAEIEHAEKKREIEDELNAILDKYNIVKAEDNAERRD